MNKSEWVELQNELDNIIHSCARSIANAKNNPYYTNEVLRLDIETIDLMFDARRFSLEWLDDDAGAIQ